MAERPILFSTPLVRAILAGKKTQTRRPVTGRTFKVEPGDRLYVRETWAVECLDADPWCWHDNETDRHRVVYRADCKPGDDERFPGAWGHASREEIEAGRADGWLPKWRPSIHMPKRHARLWLRVVNVRIEPLGHMSHDDALGEGFDNRDHFAAAWEAIYGRGAGPDLGACARIAPQRVHVVEFEVES